MRLRTTETVRCAKQGRRGGEGCRGWRRMQGPVVGLREKASSALQRNVLVGLMRKVSSECICRHTEAVDALDAAIRPEHEGCQ